MALRRWLAGLACACVAGSLVACDSPFTSHRNRSVSADYLPGVEAGQQAAGSTGGGDPAQARAGADRSEPGGSVLSGGTFTAADETLRILTDQDLDDRDDLVETLESDQDILALIGAFPLINDGGAVFLAEGESGSPGGFRTAAYDVNSLYPPRWKRLAVGTSRGKFDNALRCRDPQSLGDATGYRSICLDRNEGVADITTAQRVQGWFVIDRYPYSRDQIRDIKPGVMLKGMGAKLMSLVSFSHSRFRRTNAGWTLDSVSPTQINLAQLANQSVHITSAELASGGKVLASTLSPYALQPSKDLRSLPRNATVDLRVKVAGADPWVFAEEGGKIVRLFDSGLAPDDRQGDGIYSGRIDTPSASRKVHRLMVHAYAGRMLGNETQDDYDADTWIVPLRVD